MALAIDSSDRLHFRETQLPVVPDVVVPLAVLFLLLFVFNHWHRHDENFVAG
jgi:G:T-mismatch repair DNA endonuclease (very short patch repair protein)